MERVMSQEERIKRAEEIYNRRRTNNYNGARVSSSMVNATYEKKEYTLYRKMAIQILICIVIYVIFYLVKNTNYMFSNDVLEKTKKFLEQDINFQNIYQNAVHYFQENQEKFSFLTGFFQQEQKKEEPNNTINNTSTQNQTTNDTNPKEQENNTQTTNTAAVGIGGSSEEEPTVETVSKEDTKKTQIEIDAEYIKNNFEIQKPLSGTITSRYGKREATQIVSENHQGIDIGVNIGTTIVASMEGKVSVVSSEGEYGIHVKIVNKDITTIYAHCSKILVKEGDTIKKGQKIALSGNTGKTTGPHLHFEIRRDSRTINPELVLKF